MNRSIFILGCGYVGLPLACELLKLGHTVSGTTTSEDKKEFLNSFGIKGLVFHLQDSPYPPLPNEYFSADTLIITLPFKRSYVDPTVYLDQIKHIIKPIRDSKIDTVLFTSSTMVYPSNNSVVNEDTRIEPQDERQRVLFEIEQFLSFHPGFQSCILRLSGLYGPDREIGHFLSGAQLQKCGDTPVNLVHVDDVVGVISRLIQTNCYPDILNVVSDNHPTREQLYKAKCEHLGLDPPTFLAHNQPYKIVSNSKIKSVLGYLFKHPDPLGAIHA